MSERCERPSLFGFPFLFCIIQKSFPKLKVSRNPFVSLGPFDSAGSRWSVWVASSMNGSFPRRPGRSWDPAEIPLAPWWKRVVQRVPNGENRGSLDISVVSLVMSQGRNWRLPAPTQPQMLWVFWLQLKELEAISPTRVGIEPRNGYITHSSWRRLMTHDSWPKKSNGLWQEEPRTLVFLVTTLGKVHRRWYPCSPVEVYWSPVGKRRLSVFLDHVGATWPFEIGECQLESVEKNWVKPHSTRLVDSGGWCTWTFAKLGAWYGNPSRNLVMGNPTFEKHWTDMKLHGTINQLKSMKLAIWTSQKCYHWKVRPKVQVLFFTVFQAEPHLPVQSKGSARRKRNKRFDPGFFTC